MNSIFVLAQEYLKIGCVAIGGGYTVVPFLYYLVDKYKWFDVSEITQMLAVSNLTPGPIGINMATFVGLKVGGIFGAVLVTFAFLFPSFIIICLLSKFIKKHKDNPCLCNVMYGLRPAAVALIGVAGLKIINSTVVSFSKFKISHNFSDLISLKALVLLAVFTIIGLKLKKNPMILIAIAIIIGLVLKI